MREVFSEVTPGVMREVVTEVVPETTPETGTLRAPAERINPRVIGFDFGLKRIGVATGNTRTGTSQGLSTLRAKGGTPDWHALAQIIDRWRPSIVVVGLPLNMDGSDSAMAVRARQFARRVRARFDLAVVFVDERLSTAAADQLLIAATAPGKSLNRKRLKARDAVAAELLVRAYLEGARK